jgi:hypothetical protein
MNFLAAAWMENIKKLAAALIIILGEMFLTCGRKAKALCRD